MKILEKMYNLSETSFSVSAKLENQEQKELVNKVLTKIQTENGVTFDSFRTAFMWMVNHFDGVNSTVNDAPKNENELVNQITLGSEEIEESQLYDYRTKEEKDRGIELTIQERISRIIFNQHKGNVIHISEIAPSIQDFREKNETNVNEDWTDLEVVRHALDKDAAVITKDRELADDEILLKLHQDEINLIVTINENRNEALSQLRKKDPENEDLQPESVEDTIMESVFMPNRVLHSDQFFTGITSLDEYPIYNERENG